jgi:hypothetical protein
LLLGELLPFYITYFIAAEEVVAFLDKVLNDTSFSETRKIA